MPTSAKLIGGVFLALTALYSLNQFMIAAPDIILGWKYYIPAGIIGLVIGWRSIGGNPGLGGLGSLFVGLRGAIWLVLSNGILYGGWVVVVKLQHFFIKSFGGIIDAWWYASLKYFTVIASPDMAIILVAGGCISGVAAGLANRFWD